MSSKSGKLTKKQAKALSERLLLEPKSVWDQADASQRWEIFALAERYKTFLDQAKTEREHVGGGGVVRDEAALQAAVDKVAACLAGLGLGMLGQCQSPILGPAGNVEFFLLARKPAAGTAL